MRLRAILLHLIAVAAFAVAALAQEKKPPLPPGRDPGGVAIALVSTGIDYTVPEVAQRLARDGEGELIGWDLEDQDRKPFDRSKGSTRPEWGGDGTLIASVLSDGRGVRLVPVRVDSTDPASLARAIAFVAQTPARVVVLPMWGRMRQDWEPLRQAAVRFKDVLVIVPAGKGAEAVYPAALGLDNVLAVEQGTAGVDAAGSAAGCSGSRARRWPWGRPGRRRRICWHASPCSTSALSSAGSAKPVAARCGRHSDDKPTLDPISAGGAR
jgi:hypothetical protein